MAIQARYSLVVIQGQDAGMQMVLESPGTTAVQPQIIGRSRDAGLPLKDLSVSRRHVEASLQGDYVVVRVIGGASPFMVDSEPKTEARLRAGSTFVVGDTVISVRRTEARDAPTHDPVLENERTDIRQLLDGVGADVRGLGSVFSLLESTDRATDPEVLTDMLSKWAAQIVSATAVTLLSDKDLARDPRLRPITAGEVVSLAVGPREARVVVPAQSTIAAGVAFDIPQNVADIGLTSKRILVVGARVFVQRLSSVHDLEAVRGESEALRAQAIGSARAFLGDSEAARDVARVLPKLAASDTTILILGESGCGKTFLARLVHETSARADAPLRVVNCAAIPENLVESTLFGHERGAFTGADAARPGVLEAAGRGTVLLDEIGELPLASQAKLLRVLEDKVFERVGSQREIPLRARVIAATNRDLSKAVAAGTFRADLFFRISVVSVRVPPLRDRGEDVVVLARRLLGDLVATGGGRRVVDFEEDAISVLRTYSWPGNVRELRNAIEHAIVLGEGSRVRAMDFPPAIAAATPVTIAEHAKQEDMVALPARLDHLEARAIEAALRATGGNRTRAAAMLGINRVTLYKKLKEPDPE